MSGTVGKDSGAPVRIPRLRPAWAYRSGAPGLSLPNVAREERNNQFCKSLMPIELKVPSVGESITEVEIGEWRKNPGDRVEKDEPLVILESEKATIDLPAPVTGVLAEIKKKKGQVANVGEIIGFIDETGPAQATEKPKAEAAPTTAAQEKGSGKESATRVMPAAERALAESGLKAEQVKASGPGGRLLKEDVIRHVEAGGTKPLKEEPELAKRVPQPATAEEAKPAPAPVEAPSEGNREEEVAPMSRLRRTVAARLVEAQRNAALLTTFNEVDMSAVMALRKEFVEAFQAKYNVKLGFMSFFVKAVVDALKLVPQVNAEIRGNDIVYKNYYDIGVAIGGGKGLVVPILRNAERMSFAEIEIAIGEFAKRAKDGTLKLEELQGGTFTISNGGVYGSMLSTPIVNPPQSGILGMHSIQERPVAREGQVVIRPMMYLALTYDHRIVDGREAVTFLKRIKDVIETPTRMLIEV